MIELFLRWLKTRKSEWYWILTSQSNMDLRWLVGGIFTAFAAGLLYVNCPIWSLFPAVVSVYVFGSKLLDELRR